MLSSIEEEDGGMELSVPKMKKAKTAADSATASLNPQRLSSPAAADKAISSEDISTEILLRLPVKSILNLQTFSKLWFSIISSPHFRQTHSSRHRSTRGLFFQMDLHPLGVYKFLPLTPQKISTSIFYQAPGHFKSSCVSSCNGLLLLESKIPYLDNNHNYYHIYNPTTKKCITLQIPPHICKRKFVCATLAFDPSQSPHYKVIFLWNPQPHVIKRSIKYQIEVYSSATGECEAPASNTFVARDFDCGGDYRGFFCNGAIHWLSTTATSVVYFNVHAECINRIPIPPLARKIHYFGQSQGHLHLVNSDDQYFYKCSVLDVYELKRDYSGWFLKYQVELASITSALPQDNPREDFGTYLSIFRDEEEKNDDDLSMVILVCDEWVEYSLKKKTMKRLVKYMHPIPFTSPFPWTYWFSTFQFIPTLACI